MAALATPPAGQVRAYGAMWGVAGQTHRFPMFCKGKIRRQLEKRHLARVVKMAGYGKGMTNQADMLPVGLEVVFIVRGMRVVAPVAFSLFKRRMKAALV